MTLLSTAPPWKIFPSGVSCLSDMLFVIYRTVLSECALPFSSNRVSRSTTTPFHHVCLAILFTSLEKSNIPNSPYLHRAEWEAKTQQFRKELQRICSTQYIKLLH